MLAEGCSSRCLLARECSDKSMDKRRYDRRLTKEACRLCREAVNVKGIVSDVLMLLWVSVLSVMR